MRILVIDDEERLVAGLRTGLEAEGFAVDVALDGSSVKVGPNAVVKIADVAASNGVIHAIDAVLLPPGVTLGK